MNLELRKIAEKMVRNAGFVSVRFGNVLGSNGSLIPLWSKALKEGRPLKVTDPMMERYFMTIEEACSLMIRAAEVAEPASIMVLDMGERKNIFELAKEILRKAGKENYPINIIGKRAGETLVEEVMTESERALAVKQDNFYVLKS